MVNTSRSCIVLLICSLFLAACSGADPNVSGTQDPQSSAEVQGGNGTRQFDLDDGKQRLSSHVEELTRWRLRNVTTEPGLGPRELTADELVFSRGVVALEGVPGPFKITSLDELSEAGPSADAPTLVERQTDAINTVGARLSADWFVWMEKPGTNLGVSAWVMYALNRETQEVEELARNQEMSDGPAISAPGWTGPVLIGNWVYWAQPSGTIKDVHSDIYGCKVADCKPTAVVEGAAYPARAGEQLAVVKSKFFEGQRKQKATTVELVDVPNGESSVVAKFPSDRWPSGLAASSSHVLVTSQSKGDKPDAMLFKHNGDLEMAQTRPGRHGFSYPELSTTAANWVGGNSGKSFGAAGFAYLLATEELYRVGNASGLYAIEVAGDKILWQERVKGDHIEFVIAQLPN